MKYYLYNIHIYFKIYFSFFEYTTARINKKLKYLAIYNNNTFYYCITIVFTIVFTIVLDTIKILIYYHLGDFLFQSFPGIFFVHVFCIYYFQKSIISQRTIIKE